MTASWRRFFALGVLTQRVIHLAPPLRRGHGVRAECGDDQINTDDNGDNDGITAFAGVESVPIQLLSGQESLTDGDADDSSDLTIDFGFYQALSLGDYIWFDADGDGFQDTTERGI